MSYTKGFYQNNPKISTQKNVLLKSILDKWVFLSSPIQYPTLSKHKKKKKQI